MEQKHQEVINVADRARGIRLLVMDVDGTLTDGAMYYSANGEELKRFSTRDGMGITLLRRGAIEAAIITSENSSIVTRRAEKLAIQHVILGCHDKTSALRELSERLSIPLDCIAYIGDDVNDAPVMTIVGLSACPADAVEAVKKGSHIVLESIGGNGAVREFCERILVAQNKPVTLHENW